MSIPIQAIYETTRDKYSLRLLTGPNGLTREFTWVQLCEDIGNASFFRGGELVVTTGLSCSHAGWLREFIDALIQHQACGLFIFVGKYIKEQDITKEIIAYCSEQHFPLFVLPWNVHLADIMQDYCTRLLHARQKEMELTRLLRSLLAAGPHQEQALQELQALGLENMPFFLFIFPLKARIADEQQQSIRLDWKRHLNHLTCHYELFFYKNQLVLLLEHSSMANTDFLRDIEASMPAGIFQGYAGQSAVHVSWQELSSAYKEACTAAAAASCQEKNSLAFDELGIYRLFFRAGDTALLKKMRDEQLLLLKDYDRAHHAHLLSTLRAYLFHNNSLQQTAALTFTHRNTVNYRMNKIKELTGSDFTDSVVCFHYMLAFYMEDYLRLHEPNSEKL